MAQYGRSYIAASYVKWLEGGGARVVPIPYDASEADLRFLFDRINGIVFTGGGSDLNHTRLYQTGKLLYDWVLDANSKGDTFHLQATCMGFELICLIASERDDMLTNFDSENISLPLAFTAEIKDSSLFGPSTPPDVMRTLAEKAVTMNNHMWGVGTDAFLKDPKLPVMFKLLSNSKDRDGLSFVSTIESKKFHITATQWHPEKNQYEWDPLEVIDHSPDGIYAQQYYANYVVDEARLSSHHFQSESEAMQYLIYNYPTTYTARLISSGFEECYIFP